MLQPSNSPDTNVNDMGWFRSLDVLQYTKTCKTVDQLVATIIKSFETLDHTTLNHVFLSLQGCMINIMSVRRDNNYKVPHMGKEALIRAGRLPLNLEVPKQLVKECLTYLIEAGEREDVKMIKNNLAIKFDGEEEEEC